MFAGGITFAARKCLGHSNLFFISQKAWGTVIMCVWLIFAVKKKIHRVELILRKVKSEHYFIFWKVKLILGMKNI